MSTHQTEDREDAAPKIAWDAHGTPIAKRFDDPYFSRLDGRAETRHVFLSLNGLPERWQTRSTFTIAELGFGTGLNFLETCAAWRAAPKPVDAVLEYVSFELYPLSADDLARAIAPWPDLADDCAHLVSRWPPATDRVEISFDDVRLRVVTGDANRTVPAWQGAADAWFLDGFSPAKNPDMWGETLIAAVFAHTHPGGTFATFTAAGWVRRNLAAAGFEVRKAPGYGRKRECLAGIRPEDGSGYLMPIRRSTGA